MTAGATTPDLIERLYAIPGCATGGPLHIVTDDENFDDDCLDFCDQAIDELPGPGSRGWWREHQTPADTAEMVTVAREIIARLRPMSIAKRKAVCG